MNILFISILLLFNLCFTSEEQCNPNQKLIQSFKSFCDISYSICPNSNIIFQTCTNIKCKIPLGNQCLIFTFQDLNQAKCMNLCCGIIRPHNQPFTYSQYLTCFKENIYQGQSNPEFSSKKLIIILVSVLGTTFAVIVILCFCFKQKIKSFFSQTSLQSQHAINNNSIKNNQQSKKIKFLFEQSELNIHYNKEQQCTICLSGSTQIKTKCGHWFHLKCLSSWLAKNYKCPNCVSEVINPINAVCKQCKKIYVQIHLKNKNQWKSFKKQINNLKCKLCSQK